MEFLDPVILLCFLATGLLAGVLAGLLGIGGGLVIVPVLLWLLPGWGVSESVVMHLALGTSMATIVFTSVVSGRSHWRRGSVDRRALRALIPGILLGALLGSWVADELNTRWLSLIFGAFAVLVALKMILGINKSQGEAKLSNTAGSIGGVVMGALSALVGIGGGSLVVPFLNHFGRPVVTAIGSAAVCGFPLAVFATIGYMYFGWGESALPSATWGYVMLPAMAAIAAGTMATAPIGAWLAHRLPAATLKRIFAVFLAVVGGRILVGALIG